MRYSPEKTFTKRWLTTKSYGQDSATHQDLLDKVQQLLWVSREAHEQVRSAVKSPLRRIAFRWGYGGFLREKLSWLFRLYPWLISQDPQQYRRLVTEAEAYRRRERIAEGGAVLWWLAHVWPPVRSAAKALRRALRPTSA